MKILFAGGGTAGHINPGIAIAKYVKSKDANCDILFIGTEEGMEKRLVPKEGFNIKFISVKGFNRKVNIDALTSVLYLFIGIMQSRKIISKYKPDVVIGTGGYVSGPVVFNASLMNIPTIIHEQNVIPGITTKILSKFADVVAISFAESKEYLKVKNKLIYTGNPVRKEVIYADKQESRKHLKLNKKPFILAFGGSLGASKVNETLIDIIEYIYKKDNIQLMFATGEKQYTYVIETIKKRGIDLNTCKDIKVVPYIYNMANVMAAADLVISRAGAITLSEITALGKACILIPSPNVTNNHQEYNAKALEDKGAAVVFNEDILDSKVLYDKIKELLNNSELLYQMSKNSYGAGVLNATENIYNIMTKLYP